MVMTYVDISAETGVDRQNVIHTFGETNQDSFTTVNKEDGKTKYIVTYNQHLPFALLQRGFARELGHIVLGHDETTPEEVRNEEARCFAHHLLCPRALIHTIQATGLRMTTEVLGNLTGCYEQCLYSMRKIPATHVPAELNRTIRDNFFNYSLNFFEFYKPSGMADVSGDADFGSFMEGYTEV
jgi:hypothetical protein